MPETQSLSQFLVYVEIHVTIILEIESLILSLVLSLVLFSKRSWDNESFNGLKILETRSFNPVSDYTYKEQ